MVNHFQLEVAVRRPVSQDSDPQECHLEGGMSYSSTSYLILVGQALLLCNVHMLRYTHTGFFSEQKETPPRGPNWRPAARGLPGSYFLSLRCARNHTVRYGTSLSGDTRLSQIDTAIDPQAGAVHCRQNLLQDSDSESTRRGSFLVENLPTAPLEALFILFFLWQRQSAESTRSPDTISVGSNTTEVGYHLGSFTNRRKPYLRH